MAGAETRRRLGGGALICRWMRIP
uniref:Uncharacterized protein n=1 Tax=Arundo donax TaxID=35708 RepID=A0A0A9EWU4_ARUDO